MDNEKAIRAAKLTLGGILEKRRAKTAVDRAQGQIAPSKYLPGVPRQAHAAGGKASFLAGNHPEVPDTLYHGTKSDFRSFLPMSHFGTVKAAHERLDPNLSGWERDPLASDGRRNIIPVHVSMKNPLDVGKEDGPGGSGEWFAQSDMIAQAAEKLRKLGHKAQSDAIYDVMDSLIDHENDGADITGHLNKIASHIRAAGYDGIMYTNVIEDPGSRSFVPLGPEQVKSAISARHFDPSNPDMTYATGGYVPSASLPVPKLAVARPLQQAAPQPTMFDALTGLASLGEQARGVADLVSPEKGAEKPAAAAPEALSLAAKQIGMNENTQRDALKDYLATGGANLDPATTAWCAAFVNSTLQQTGGQGTGSNMARSFLDWGQSVDQPQPGDVAVFSRGDQNGPYGHVGFFQGYDENGNILVLGGNQGDAVSVSPYSPDRLLGFRRAYADGGEVADLGQAREQKQLRDFHGGMMNDIRDRMTDAMEAHQKAVDQGVFDGYEVGDVLQASAGPMRITGKFMAPWKPTKMALQSFERMKTQPTIIEHNGRQYIPMLRYQTGREGDPDWQEGHAYFDGVKAAGYPKMGGLRAVKADGGSVADRSPMFEGMHEDLRDESGKPLDLWHGTQGQPFEAFDDKKIGQRDAGFYGRGHYLTPTKGNAEGYADPDEMGTGSVMGPLHAALKNPFIWDTSDKGSHRTLRDLQSMGIMKGQAKLEPWDNLQRHHIDPFMREMQRRGHDGVLMKTNHGLQEIVVFNPNMIKHRDAEVGDPNDPRIMRASGGKVDLYSKAAKVIRGMKDQPMNTADIVKYALGKGVKKAELDHVNVPTGKMKPSQVAEHIEGAQPQVGVVRREPTGETIKTRPAYNLYQLPGGKNYREHILTLDNHPDSQTYMARDHWGKLENPLAHIRMSDRLMPLDQKQVSQLYQRVLTGTNSTQAAGQISEGLTNGIINEREAATLARALGVTESPYHEAPGLERRILHVEEMQSDWNNDARRKGFRTGRERQDYDDYVANMRKQMANRINAGDASPMIRDALLKKAEAMDPYMLAMKLGVQEEHNTMARRANENIMAPPKAPYINPKKDDWAELAMKHVLTEAAKGGYDGVTFTPDAEQSARWGGTSFDGIYDKKLPGMAHRLVQQHDPETQPDTITLPSARRGNDPSAPMIPLSQDARDSIMKNSFPSFRRGGYVTHIRRGK